MSFLSYLEVHLTDHCNLNCKGCGHFSPICREWFIHPDDLKRDLEQLKKSVSHIELFRLLGGEPLLNKYLTELINIVVQIYPQSKLVLVTNGLLIPKLEERVFDNLKKNNVQIQITAYPDKRQKIEKYVNILETKYVDFEVFYTDEFYKHLKLNIERDNRVSIIECRKYQFCPTIKNGRLYQCSGLAHIDNFFNYFDVENLPVPEGLDIYNKNIDFNVIICFLNSPDKLCSHCFYSYESFKWAKSKFDIGDWTE